MIKRIIFFPGFLLLVFFADAQKHYTYEDSSVLYAEPEKNTAAESETYDEPETETSDISGDTSVISRMISLPADTLRAWQTDKGLADARNLDSIILAKTKTAEIKAPKSRSSSSGSLSLGWLKYVMWGIAGIFVLYVISRLFMNEGFFKKKSGSVSPVNEMITEDELYLQQNFDQLIHQACKLGDYRVATRYLFLKTLQRLSDRELIQFAIDKTNSKYVREVPSANKEDFAALVLSYEYIWYGRSEVDKELYSNIENKFSVFLNKI